MTAACSGYQRLRGSGGGHADILQPFRQSSGLGKPIDDIASSIAARKTWNTARRKQNGAPRVDQILGDLTAGRPAADNQHGSTRQSRSGSIGAGVELGQRRRQ